MRDAHVIVVDAVRTVCTRHDAVPVVVARVDVVPVDVNETALDLNESLYTRQLETKLVSIIAIVLMVDAKRMQCFVHDSAVDLKR